MSNTPINFIIKQGMGILHSRQSSHYKNKMSLCKPYSQSIIELSGQKFKIIFIFLKKENFLALADGGSLENCWAATFRRTHFDFK